MSRPGSRLRQLGWAVALVICVVGFVALTFRVNAVKSEVLLAERQIVALEREKEVLEIEFETRANQQQLADWNKVEFGYQAPRAEQYLENERQLARLGTPRGVGAPEPIRVAHAAAEPADDDLALMVSPLTGRPSAQHKSARRDGSLSLAERLTGSAALGGAGLGAGVAEAGQ